MEEKIVPCVEGDDEFLAEKLSAITDSMIAAGDPAEDELVVYKVTDGDGKLIAGCNLQIDCWRVADLDILWVDERYRRQGIGSALIREAERAARERGCRQMTLGTFDFQARPLYEKHGFTVCGTIEDCPTKGHTHYDMVKRLDDPFDAAAPGVPSVREIRPGSEEDAEQIDDCLCEYNWSKVPPVRDFEWIGRKIPGDDGIPAAGCFVGVNFWNMAFLELLWVDEPLRRRGLGSRLLSEAEREAKEAGAPLIMGTARGWNVGFFEKRGYTTYCVQEDCPHGHRKYKMLKRL